ncbi:Serine/threonine phosphatase stp [compost metagenome]|uniref:Serine/threonine protein phosphatase PrpC n=1 Tax=Variovorax boronicumulans TaxID=436515 RepID=A0AAW8DSB1_9BURK|nr:PP2C family serine/threonine-protein phosphatase [Variovorax boronicumulans]MDP9876914.1 serine/threonine protein phosphatase PrpC [Variovorax boronicumulans]MDP9912830.1 serine/threonine protein phosphatase PrpC [Variovorax boronicumulans]MDP9918903.1 serine/threonine protein phosphatase PrpC [Variovorax boronicumulans]MDP9922209.1 serine/threonine protein phosphatase PrpC [Variovorax boronicumulans]OEZ27134.1 serine/threonine protein phosphatase [Variovorax boronicumulans]
MEIEIVTLSRQGGRTYNEDVHGHWHDERYVACLVADGAGGHGGGDVAAATVRASVLGGFSGAPSLDEAALRALIERANLDVVARQAEGGKLAGMRSTVVFAVIDLEREVLAWVHSGDSRAYLFRGGAIVARTTDHSLVQQMVAGGMLDEEGARLHPQRNMLLSALGSIEEAPDIAVSDRMRLLPGDVLLLCSDGVWEPLGDECLVDTLHASRTPSQWTELLDAQIKANAKPGHDNYTALTLWVIEDADDDLTRLLPENVASTDP